MTCLTHIERLSHILNTDLAQNSLVVNLLSTLIQAQMSKIAVSDRCSARIHNGSQCSRKRHSHASQFCGSHANSLPYGRIDIQLAEHKSARKKLSNTGKTVTDYTRYVRTSVINIGGTDYLIDDNGVVYEHNSENTIVALRVKDNEYQWF